MIVNNLFCLMSDLHGEFLSKPELRDELTNYIRILRRETPPEITTAVLAGDVAPAFHPCLPGILREVREHFPTVIYIPGNHEYYQVKDGSGVKDVECQWKRLQQVCQEESIHLLDRGCFQLTDDTVLLGCTLWYRVDSDLQKTCTISDIREICEEGGKRPFSVKDRFKGDYDWLENSLKTISEEGKRAIVVTHHLPFGPSVIDYLQRPPISYPYSFYQSSGFSTDLSDMIRRYCQTIDGWCFGHTHTKLSFRDPFSGCKFFSNPYGYPFENKADKR